MFAVAPACGRLVRGCSLTRTLKLLLRMWCDEPSSSAPNTASRGAPHGAPCTPFVSYAEPGYVPCSPFISYAEGDYAIERSPFVSYAEDDGPLDMIWATRGTWTREPSAIGTVPKPPEEPMAAMDIRDADSGVSGGTRQETMASRIAARRQGRASERMRQHA